MMDNDFSDNYTFVPDQSLDMVTMDEELRDRFHSIEVLNKFIGNFHVNKLYFPVVCSLFGRSWEKKYANIRIGSYIYRGSLPVFLWMFWWEESSESYYTLFLLKLEKDFTLTYPITKADVCMTTKEFTREELIHSEEELIGELDRILHSL